MSSSTTAPPYASHSSHVLLRCLNTGVSVDREDQLGCTAIINAAANGNGDFISYLLSAGAQVNSACRRVSEDDLSV